MECKRCGGTQILLDRNGEPKDCPDCGSTAIRDAKMRKIQKFSSMNGRSASQTFENYDAGGSSVLELAKKMTQRWAAREKGWFPWLVLHGPPGVGKSHLASAAVNLLLARGEFVVYMTAPEMLIALRESFSKQGESFGDALDKYLKCEWLVLDDWGAEKASDWASEVWFTIFNSRYRNGLATMVTSNLNLSRAGNSGVDERLIDRLNEVGFSILVNVKAKSWREKQKQQDA